VKVVKVAPRQFDAGRLTAPKEIPKDVKQIIEAEMPPTVAQVAVMGGVNLISGAPTMNIPAFAPPPPPPPPVVKEAPKAEAKPVPIGGKIQEGLLTKKISPAYPDLAKRTRIQGPVKYQAVIGKDGKIQDLKLVSGNPMLATPAVMDAVSQWEYKPYLLNGEPTPVITEIIVNFVLN